MWSEKNRNGAVSPYSSPWKIIGVNGDRTVSSAASGRAATGSRSPNARLPTWSWLAEKTTNRSGGTSSAGAPKRRSRKLDQVPSWTCGRWNALASVPSDANSAYQPSVSPVSATRSAWWKSSAHAASQPQPPTAGSRITFGSLSPDSAITIAAGFTAWTRRASSATTCSGLESTSAWIASSRSPSRWKSRIHASAAWQIHSRTASERSSSRLTALPHGVAYLSVKYGPNASIAWTPDAPRWLETTSSTTASPSACAASTSRWSPSGPP